MKRFVSAFLPAALALALPTASHAQATHYVNRPLEINVHAGGLVFDEDLTGDTEILLGARAAWNFPNGLGIGGNLDYSQLELTDESETFDVDVLLYSAEIDYTFPSESTTHFFVLAGVGGARFSFSDLEDVDEDSETELLIPLGGGVKWFQRTTDQNWGLRFEVRDNIIQVSGDGDEEDATTHNIEFSGGLSFFFGRP